MAIDDCSRVAYGELLPDETAASAVVLLEHAVAWFATPPISRLSAWKQRLR